MDKPPSRYEKNHRHHHRVNEEEKEDSPRVDKPLSRYKKWKSKSDWKVYLKIFVVGIFVVGMWLFASNDEKMMGTVLRARMETVLGAGIFLIFAIFFFERRDLLLLVVGTWFVIEGYSHLLVISAGDLIVAGAVLILAGILARR